MVAEVTAAVAGLMGAAVVAFTEGVEEAVFVVVRLPRLVRALAIRVPRRVRRHAPVADPINDLEPINTINIGPRTVR